MLKSLSGMISLMSTDSLDIRADVSVCSGSRGSYRGLTVSSSAREREHVRAAGQLRQAILPSIATLDMKDDVQTLHSEAERRSEKCQDTDQVVPTSNLIRNSKHPSTTL